MSGTNSFSKMFALVLVGVMAAGAFSPANAVVVRDYYPAHGMFWTGRAHNGPGQADYQKHTAEVMFGKDAQPGKWQGWIKIDLTGLPEDVVIAEASLFYHLISQHNDPATYVTHAEVDPVVSEPKPLWDAIVQGAEVSPSIVAPRGWVERPLNSAGIQAVQSAIAQGWITFGLFKYDDEDAFGHVKGYQADRFRPYLRLTFSATDMGIVEIQSPVGEVSTGVNVIPSVLVVNKGDAEVPYNLLLTISDEDNELYRRELSLPPLPVGQQGVIAFPEWNADLVGGERIVAATLIVPNDVDLSDNYAVSWFEVVLGNGDPPPLPQVRWGWEEVRPVPQIENSRPKPVKSGAWLAVDPVTGVVYGARGNKTGDFFSYDPSNGLWRKLASIPAKVGRGARGVADGKGNVYMVRGSGTSDFMRYDIAANRWENLPEVPLAGSGKRVKAGAAMVHVPRYGMDYIYLIKGPKQDFLRYSVQAGEWAVLDNAPAGASAKWRLGSWVVYDGDSKLYAHKAPRHEMWVYDLSEETWAGQVAPMPYVRSLAPGRSRKMKEGASAAWRDNGIYSLKSGKTDQFWRYDAAEQKWSEHLPMPDFGTTLKKVAVGPGGDLINYPFSRTLYAYKGNKTHEFWRFVMEPLSGSLASGADVPLYVGIEDRPVNAEPEFAAVLPNPVSGRAAQLRYAVPVPGPARLSVFDAAGRVALRQNLSLDRSGRVSLALSDLRAGSYIVRVEGSGFTVSTRMIVTD